jgi:hypothetical protein
MPPFQGFRFVGDTYSQGVALGCHIFSLSGWYLISHIFTLLILPSLPCLLIVDLDLPPGAGYSLLLCGGRGVAAI